LTCVADDQDLDRGGLITPVGVEILQVLAVSYVPESPMEAKVLVEWSVTPVSEALSDAVSHISDQLGGLTLAEEFHPPHQSHLHSRWVSMVDLITTKGCFFSVSMMREMSQRAILHHHWSTSLKHEHEAVKKEKHIPGKDKKVVVEKKGVIEDSKLVVSSAEPLNLPPTMLIIDTSTMTHENENYHLRISVVLQGDIIAPIEGNILPPLTRATLALQTLGMETVSAEGITELEWVTDVKGCRVDLDLNLPVPILTQEVTIPIKKGVTRAVLWVRLLTLASVHVQFCCALPLAVVPADSCGELLGLQMFVRDGMVAPTVNMSEQLMFRAKIAYEPTEKHFPEMNTRSVSQLSHEPTEISDSQLALAFLHIPHTTIPTRISMMLGNDNCSDMSPLARLEGALLPLSTETSTLIGRCIQSNEDLPSFKWQLIILSTRPIR
jgi:hypothetical protein